MTNESIALDPIELSRALIRFESVTPDQGDTLDYLSSLLEPMGFRCHKLIFEEEGTEPVANLYARRGTDTPNFCFAGHTDVVPVGAQGLWSADPFAAEIRDGQLYGRGASDMKSAIAAFVAAIARTLNTADEIGGSISLLITGDEEGPAINGTTKVLDWMREHGEKIDYCLVGEPTNPREMGDMIKMGRRGSMHGYVTCTGTQGHVAYPHMAHNPIPDLVKVLAELNKEPLDEGNEHFQPSNLEIVDISNNLGEARSIATHPWSTTHKALSEDARLELGITPGLIRFSCGLEDGDDLINDIMQALDKAGV